MGVYIGKSARLPSEYQEVEYIATTSVGPYINTGYIPTSNTKTKCKVMVTGFKSGSTSGGLYGVWVNWSGNGRYNLWYWSGSGYGFGYANNNGSSYCVNVGLNTVAEIENYISGGTVYNIVNGTTITYSGGTYATPSGNMYLFKRNTGSTDDSDIAYSKFYYCEIYESGTLVRNFIPCYRKSDNVIGLYDLVNNQFYTNSGSGTFSKGEDVLDKIDIVDAYVGKPYSREPDSSRTLLYLPLESNAIDYSGNSISTTPSNVTYASLGGVMCANANGSSSKIQLSNTSFLPSDTTGGTISFLVYGTSRTVGSTYRKALEFSSSNANIGVYYRTGNNGIWCNGFNNDGYITDSDATLNSWHLITFTFDSTNCYAYFDGVIKFGGSRNSSNPIWGKTPDVTGFYILCNRSGNNNRWSGGGRELIIEKVKRSAEDVLQYYQYITKKLGIN